MGSPIRAALRPSLVMSVVRRRCRRRQSASEESAQCSACSYTARCKGQKCVLGPWAHLLARRGIRHGKSRRGGLVARQLFGAAGVGDEFPVLPGRLGLEPGDEGVNISLAHLAAGVAQQPLCSLPDADTDLASRDGGRVAVGAGRIRRNEDGRDRLEGGEASGLGREEAVGGRRRCFLRGYRRRRGARRAWWLQAAQERVDHVGYVMGVINVGGQAGHAILQQA